MLDEYLRQLEQQLDFHNHKIAYHEKMAEKVNDELRNISDDPEFAMDNAVDSMNFRHSLLPKRHNRYTRRYRRSSRYKPINDFSDVSDYYDDYNYRRSQRHKPRYNRDRKYNRNRRYGRYDRNGRYERYDRNGRYDRDRRYDRDNENEDSDPEWLKDMKNIDKSKSHHKIKRGMFDIHDDKPEFQGDDMKRLDERMKQARLEHEKSQKELEKERTKQQKENDELKKLGEFMLDGVSSSNSENSENGDSDTAITYSNVDRVIDDSDYDSQEDNSDYDSQDDDSENNIENTVIENKKTSENDKIPMKRDDNIDNELEKDNSSINSELDDNIDSESVNTKDLQNFDDNPDTEMLSKYTQKVLKENKKNRNEEDDGNNNKPEKFVKDTRNITIFDKRKPSDNYKDMESLLKIAKNEIDEKYPDLSKSDKKEDKEKRDNLIYTRADELFNEWKTEMENDD